MNQRVKVREPRPSGPKVEQWVLWPGAGRMTLTLFLLALVTLVFFRAFPNLDLAPSRAFFNPQHEFPLALDPFWDSVREVFFLGQRLIVLASWVWLGVVFWNRPAEPLDLAKPLLAAVSAFLGPLLVVNWTLKEFWGRPRPFQTLEFNGQWDYLPPGSIGDACTTNCSFVSGEAAGAFWLLWLVVLVPPRWRPAAAVLILASAVLTATLRVAFGRHYISDVMIGGMVGFGSVTLVAAILQSNPGRRFIARLLRAQ